MLYEAQHSIIESNYGIFMHVRTQNFSLGGARGLTLRQYVIYIKFKN